VTAPTGTATGSYTVSARTVADAAHAAVTANATFWIDAAAPNPPTNLRASAKGNKVALSWTAATDTGGSGIARYEIRRGAVVAGTSASTTYSDSPGNGTFIYTVVAIDGAGNVSAPSSAVTAKIGRTK
jgi:hypothetical protein